MNIVTHIRRNGSTICTLLALILFMFSLIINSSSSNADNAARRVERKLEKRMKILDTYIREALDSDHSQWLVLDDLPEDMVIYRYVYDTLQSWSNQFPVLNDDISTRVIFQRLSNQKVNLASPLNNIGETPKYINLGPEWFIIKAVSDGTGCKVIAGLEIKNTLIDNLHKTDNGVNKKLGLSWKFTILPINFSGGSPVCFEGNYMFKVISEAWQATPFMTNSLLRWLALLLTAFASILYLLTHRTIKTYIVNSVFLLVLTGISYIWGMNLQESTELFSPTVYADGQFFYSFGALMILNLAIFLLLFCTFSARNIFIRKMVEAGRKSGYIIYSAAIILLIICVTLYSHFTLKSLIMNSNISFEMYLWHLISVYTVMVYISYTGLMFGILMLVQMLMPAIHKLFGNQCHLFTKRHIIIFTLLFSLYFTLESGILGFKKENDRIVVMTNQLAIERDLGLELQLRGMEDAIANDPFIAALTTFDQSSNLIVNRITENYMTRIAQTHDISISLCRATDVPCHERFDKIIDHGSPIEPSSRFVYIYNINGVSGYAGSFIYYTPEAGVVRVLIEVYPKTYRDDKGYYSILGKYSKLGETPVPNIYSYGKYVDGQLVRYKGDYAYPTILDSRIIASGRDIYRVNGYVHFINQPAEGEIIIVSRRMRTPMRIFVTFSYLFLIFYILLSFTARRKNRNGRIFRRNYFRSSINAIILISLTINLVAVTMMSTTFIIERNESNVRKMMTSKISTIQAMLDSEFRTAQSYMDLNTTELGNILKDIGQSTESDITLYTPDGKVFKSTTPDVFEKRILGSRMNQDAYYNIKYKHQRFYIHSEYFEGQEFSFLYAPVFNSHGKMIAIICSPYNDHNYNFRQEALFHTATILNIFFILLAVTLIVSRSFSDKMFRPLEEIGNKIASTDINGLEYIIYKRDDEISTIVDAYNRMVHDLSASTKLLTQAERDKAWSEMARQVAHEIKNPLTPIKLEIQRLIRLKQKNDPSWEEKFDKVSAIVLEHIDILTDTANEFSTFAKLYSEEPVIIDLDRTLRDQMTIFDNRENIDMDYIGLSGATVLAPKPQLIRVFVNLMTNAIQAIDIQQKECAENGTETVPGRIFISLRNSSREGYYDVVFEDNGPGVNEEMMSKLFTPNFTTKSGGSGLGLAICRNIIERCNGEITYRRSQMLKGACFMVSLPKYNQ